MNEGEPILIEISPGELIDRLTILQIRSEHVTDPEQHRMVCEELETLARLRDEVLPASQELEALADELMGVNEALWQLEDDIRAADHSRGRLCHIIELARSVCRMNDRRSELKRSINSTLGCLAADQKQYGACAV